MDYWELSAFGFENFAKKEGEKPEAGAGQVLVEFKAASINYRDFLIVNGMYNPNMPLPTIPVSDGAGDVVAIGDGVSAMKVGDRVMPAFFPLWDEGVGTWAKRSVSSGCEVPGVAREFGAYDESAVVKVPDFLSYEEAACFPVAALTAWRALKTYSNVQPGQWVLAQGTGGVSLFALQFSKAMGANVIVTSSSDDKLARVKDLGADHVINYKETPEWGAKAAELSEGGINATIDVGGAATIEQAMNACGPEGHITLIGNMGGISLELNILPIIGKNLHIHGETAASRAEFEEMMVFAAQHQIHPVIDKSFGFGEIKDAIGELAQGNHFGKLVVSY